MRNLDWGLTRKGPDWCQHYGPQPEWAPGLIREPASGLRTEKVCNNFIFRVFSQVSPLWDCSRHVFIMKSLLFKLTAKHTYFGELAFI